MSMLETGNPYARKIVKVLRGKQIINRKGDGY